jgi:uncharacterized protein YbjT (DUF2867 family)
MRAFVVGATGYTGKEVVRELALHGVDVVAHVRPDSPRLRDWQQSFGSLGAQVDTTPWQPDTLTQTFHQLAPTHVFGLLGTTQARARKDNSSYESVDYALTAMVLDATLAANPAATFVYLSALGVKAGARNSYLAVRWRLETKLRESGLRYVIAHPALITGSDREEFRLGERAAAAGVRIFLGAAGAIGMRGLRDRFATLSGKQLARALVNAALDERCANRVLEVPELAALAKA